MTEFTRDYTTPYLPYWDEAIGDRNGRYTKGIEVGVFEGRSTLAFVERYLAHPDSFLIAIDRFPPWPAARRFFSNVAPHLRPDKSGKVRPMEGDSFDSLAKIRLDLVAKKRAGFDFVYIDGSHLTWDVFSDLALSFRLLKVGGVLICDDYDFAPGPEYPRREWTVPKLAIDAFEACYGPKIERIESHPRQRTFRRIE